MMTLYVLSLGREGDAIYHQKKKREGDAIAMGGWVWVSGG